MSSELERRLERALGEAPGPDPGVTDRALRSALEALPSPGEARRIRRRRIALLLAACMAAFVSGGVTLAATGAHLPVVNPEPAKKTTRSGPRFPAAGLPAGTSIWAVAGGRVVVVTKQTPIRRLHGERVVAFSASPGSLYAVEGAAGRCARSRSTGSGSCGPVATGGRPVAAVWSPFPIRIAYLLRTASGYTVGDIWGTGTHPFTVDTTAAPRDAHLAVELEGAARTSSGIRRSRGPRRHRRREPVAPTGMRDTAAGGDRVRSAGGALAVADRAGRCALVDTSGGRAARCLAGAAAGPTWPGSAAATSSSRPAPHSAGMRSLAPRRSRAPS